MWSTPSGVDLYVNAGETFKLQNLARSTMTALSPMGLLPQEAQSPPARSF